MTTQDRQPAGTPSGGQFATTPKTEGKVSLAEDPKVTAAREAASKAFAELVRVDPVAASDLWEGDLMDQVSAAPYAQILVETDEHGGTVLLDPYTGEETRLVAEDVSFRWTSADQVHPEDKVVTFDYDGGDHQGHIYRSEATCKPVSLPEGWAEE